MSVFHRSWTGRTGSAADSHRNLRFGERIGLRCQDTPDRMNLFITLPVTMCRIMTVCAGGINMAMRS